MPDVLLDRPRSSNGSTPIEPTGPCVHLEAVFLAQVPSDGASLAAPAPDAGVLIDHLPHALARALREIASDTDEENSDLAATLLAGFAVLLARYTSLDRLRVHVPMVHMEHAGGDVLEAIEASTHFEFELQDAPPFTTVPRKMREHLYATHDIPDVDAAHSAPAAMDGIACTYQRFSHDHIQPYMFTRTHVGTNLRLEILDTPGCVQLIWHYPPQRYEHATIARMNDHFQTLLTSITAGSTRPISHLPILSVVEQHQLLVEWNATATQHPIDRCVHELFEAQVERTPDAIALLFGDLHMTYRELNRRANKLARQLRLLGVGPDHLVGLCMDRAPEQVIGVLAILKAGGAYVPLDPTYPRERLALVLQDTQAPVLLTQRHLYAQLPSSTCHVICVDDDRGVTNADDTNLVNLSTADNLAYVIYTSGSTGTPKGVLIEQRSLSNHTFAMVESHGLDASDRVLLFVSLSFDAAAAALFPPLIAGATLVLPEVASSQLVGGQLTELCERQSITVVQLPSSVWHHWVDALAVRGEPLRAPLKVLLVGGESPSVEKLRSWATLVRHPMKFLNAYGPTEAAITATLYQTNCDHETLATLSTLPIGRPLPNTRIYLLDPCMQPVPIGVPGEVYIGGVGLARGYLNRPELTAERFVVWSLDRKPWITGNGAAHASAVRLYKTGDLARYRPDGNIEFLERVDQQVKIRGFRIELGEIEAVLRRHPTVQHAVVVACADEHGLQRLVAYIVTAERHCERNGQADGFVLKPQREHELLAFLREKLPEYMIPTIIVPLKRLPLTSNGKIDRRALPAPPAHSIPHSTTLPCTPEEALLAAIWAKVLGRPVIGIHDDFFALGGHSLLAALLVAQVSAALKRTIPLRLLFEAPSVAKFAKAIAQDDMQPSTARPSLDADVFLDPDIRSSVSAWSPISPAAILVTGATGFFGAFLLCELLMQTHATIYCLVRSATNKAGGQRIRRALEGYGIWRDGWESRIVPVAGDLGAPQLGLDASTFRHLARTVDVLYHAGAEVHYLRPYEALKPANVGGTVEILRMATMERTKPVHYISTLAVGAVAGTRSSVFEDDALADCTSNVGYIQSKWVAEKIIHLARARGVPVSVYRPTRIGWDTNNTATNRDDFFVRLLAGCCQLGLAPDIPMVENLIPVDYTARAIVHLAQQPACANKTFHLQNSHPTRWSWVIDMAQSLGYPIQMVAYHTWFNALQQAALRDAHSDLQTLLMLMPEDPTTTGWIDGWARQTFDTQNTRAGLAGSALRCPTIDTLMLKRLLATMIRSELFGATVATNLLGNSLL